jgi:hypothetical protein
MREPLRDLDISDELPPQTPIEKSRDIRQVSHCEWALARHARAKSRRLYEQARALREESQALMEHQPRRASSQAQQSPAYACRDCDTVPLSHVQRPHPHRQSHADEFSD